MANLTLNSWVQYVPNLGENRSLEKPFFLEVKASLTKAQYAEYLERLHAWRQSDGGESAEGIEPVFADLVRMGTEALTVDGRPVATLRDYLELVAQQRGADLLYELIGAIAWHNSVEGVGKTFSERLSGGWFSTATNAPKTAAMPAGSATSR